MFPIRVAIKEGTLDIKEYDFEKDVFIGSNNKEYKIDDIVYFVIPKNEMVKILSKSDSVKEKVAFTKKIVSTKGNSFKQKKED